MEHWASGLCKGPFDLHSVGVTGWGWVTKASSPCQTPASCYLASFSTPLLSLCFSDLLPQSLLEENMNYSFCLVQNQCRFFSQSFRRFETQAFVSSLLLPGLSFWQLAVSLILSSLSLLWGLVPGSPADTNIPYINHYSVYMKPTHFCLLTLNHLQVT